MAKAFFLGPLLLLLFGCNPILKLEPITPYNKQRVTVVDNRSELQKAPRSDSLMSVFRYIGDKQVTPPALEILKSKLVKYLPDSTPIHIEVSDLSVIDYFPNRLGFGTKGVLAWALTSSATDWDFVESLGLSKAGDSIVCVFIGKINGKKIEAATYSTYDISAFAGLVVNDPSFKKHAAIAIDTLALRISESYLGTSIEETHMVETENVETTEASIESANVITTESNLSTESFSEISGTYASEITTGGPYSFKNNFRNMRVTIKQEGSNISIKTLPKIDISVTRENDKIIFATKGNTACGCNYVDGEWFVKDGGNRLEGKWTSPGGGKGTWDLIKTRGLLQ